MKQIRHNVFETNSSSTHSMIIHHNGIQKNEIPIGEDGYIHVKMNEFGWEVRNYYSQYDRLSYLITMFATTSGAHILWVSDKDELNKVANDLMNNKWFKGFSKEIAKHAKCKGLKIDPSEGYIDHQSCEYGSVIEFLNEWDTDAMEFVFGHGIIVHTDNDNH